MKPFRILFLFMLLLLWHNGTAQEKSAFKRTIEDSKYMLTGGLSYQNKIGGEIGVMYGRILGIHGPLGLSGLKVSSEFIFNSNSFCVGPKLSYEYDIMLFGTRLNIIDYTDFKKQDLRITPEIGFTYFGFISLFYGYHIPVSRNRIDYISRNRISLTINFCKIYY